MSELRTLEEIYADRAKLDALMESGRLNEKDLAAVRQGQDELELERREHAKREVAENEAANYANTHRTITDDDDEQDPEEQ